MIKLSIIIPYYNTLKATEELIEILNPQLNDKVEVIIINDGSVEKIDHLKHKHIKIINQKNGGVSKARNKGLDEARGEYIAFIDSDDKVADNYIETILEKTKENWDYCLISWKAIGKLKGEYIINNQPPKWNTSIWNCIYKKELIGSKRFNVKKQIAEDEDFNNRVRKGKKANITDIMYIYNSGREGSLTDLYSKGKIERELPTDTQILVYQKAIGPIGGIETFLYQFLSALKDEYDIVFVYDHIHRNQRKRFQKLVKCIKNTGQKFTCDKYICASNQRNIADQVNSRENFYADMVHADFKSMGWKYRSHPKTNISIAVSETALSGVKDQIKNEIKVIYNLLKIPKPEKVLFLVSATRLSYEKGQNRLNALAERLNERNIPFVWNVFTSDLPNKTIDGFTYRKPTYNVIDYMHKADYVVHLPDCESWCYTTAEALEVGTPLIVTDYPAIHEQGFKDGVHGFLMNQNMSNIDGVIDNMLKSNLKGFKYKKLDNKQQWIDLLGKKEKQTNYTYEPMICKVKALQKYTDVVLGRTIQKGEIIEIDDDRLDVLKYNRKKPLVEEI